MSHALQTSKAGTVAALFQKHKDQIQAALPRHLDADRMLRITMTCVRRTPKLAECDPKSLFGAVIEASQLGLEPGIRAHLVPFGKEVQLIADYRGLMDLARRSGEIGSISAHAVHEGDDFDFVLGTDSYIRHRPKGTGPVTHVYAVAKWKDGKTTQFEVMTAAEVEAVKAKSRGANSASSPWKTDYDAMAKKSVIRRLCKYLPSSMELQRAVVLDEAGDRGEQRLGTVIEGSFEAEPAPPREVDTAALGHEIDEARAQQ